MQTKSVTIEAMDEAGKGLARIAVLSAVDSDGDTYAPGAFGTQWCSILPAHDRQAAPLGKARVYEEGDAALAELIFNLDNPDAKSWHSAILFDLANGDSVQEYSYGYDVLDMDYQVRGQDRVRLLKRLDVHEVSPVLVGAGVGTGTLDEERRAQGRALRPADRRPGRAGQGAAGRSVVDLGDRAQAARGARALDRRRARAAARGGGEGTPRGRQRDRGLPAPPVAAARSGLKIRCRRIPPRKALGGKVAPIPRAHPPTRLLRAV
jgi:hypothetical protein